MKRMCTAERSGRAGRAGEERGGRRAHRGERAVREQAEQRQPHPAAASQRQERRRLLAPLRTECTARLRLLSGAVGAGAARGQSSDAPPAVAAELRAGRRPAHARALGCARGRRLAVAVMGAGSSPESPEPEPGAGALAAAVRGVAALRGRCVGAAAARCAWCARRPACVARRGGRRPVTQREEAPAGASRREDTRMSHVAASVRFVDPLEAWSIKGARRASNRRNAWGRMLRRVKCRFKGSEGKERRAECEPAGCDRIAVCSWRCERCSRPGELVSPSSASSRAVESLDSKHSCSSVVP